MVCIQGSHHPANHMTILSDAFLQPSSNEASLVLQLITLHTWEPRVLLYRLRGSYWVGIAILYRLPGHFLILVLPVGLSVAECNLDELIVHCISFRKSSHAVIG
ncbi:hypothetical protein SDC9_75293 [bioreactor metagenome]|uniref:Uncharacterized protein n=1 Tax=bioreactor metagenome TaxID=1076179 RepID=A0A644YJL6_9ZZZZ